MSRRRVSKTGARHQRRSRWRLLLGGGVFALLAVFVVWNLATTAGSSGSGLAPEETASPLRLATMDGTFDLAAQRGNVVLLYFSFIG